MEKIKFKLSPNERDLILDHVFIIDDEILDPIKISKTSGKHFILEYSVDDLESLVEFVAAETNHAENRKIEAKLDTLYEKLNGIFESAVN